MGRPILLYGLAPLVNASFESDAGGTAPSGWDTSQSVNASQQVVADVFHSAGPGIPSARAMRQHVVDGTAGNKAVALQRFQLADVLAVLKAEGGELAAGAAFRPGLSEAMANGILKLAQYQGGTATIGSGTLLTPPASRSWVTAGPGWFLKWTAQEVHASCDWLELSLRYELVEPFVSGAFAWWDRVFCGGLVELQKRFRQWRPRTDPGLAINQGDGVAEIVRVRQVRSDVDVRLVNLLHGSDDELAVRRFVRWLETGTGFLAMWADSDDLTNAGRHYQRLAHVDDLRIDFPPGVLRRDYDFRFVAPAEGTG